MPLTHVLEPITIGGMEIKNRIFRSAHTTGYGWTFGDRLIAYHEARARGGVGLTVIEAVPVHPSGTSTTPTPNFWSGVENGDGYRRLVDSCKPHGMTLFQQIGHGGSALIRADGDPPWSVSDIPGARAGIVPVSMTKGMIDEVIAGFIDAAEKCARYGLDGVEVHAAHGYLLNEFLSPNTNKRTDDYGGSFENRSRFVREVLSAIRTAVPRDFVVGVRVGDDVTPGGFHSADALRLCKDLEKGGLIDYVSVSLGNQINIDRLFGGMYEPAGYELPYSEQITSHVDLPTLVIGRFRTLEEADQTIRSGIADMVGMTRAHIADPDLVRKTVEGRALEVRPCIGCNQVCVGRVTMGAPLGCAVNAGAGLEEKIGDAHVTSAATAKTVVVVGGGPAGLEAARIAALKGHRVILFEARAVLGGALRYAAMAPTRHGIADIVDWLEREIYRLGVDVRLSTYAEIDDLTAEPPDVVIVATGSAPRMDGVQVLTPGEPIKGVEQAHVLSSADVFERQDVEAGKRAVVLDDLGHYEAIATAEYLLNKGLDVTFVSTKPSFAPQTEWSLMGEPALKRMLPKGLKVLTRMRLTEITRNSVIAMPTVLGSYSNMREDIPADYVVLVSHNRSIRNIADGLAATSLKVELVGDALSPRYLQAAIRDGHLAAHGIE
ncbi:2,4-dienoyl-CoA reductase-like NADH-dependent reductase (Old Yellow Enzyme family)/thioredoxin reductase [Sphingobium xenophagum]|uniref:2,4-dienoyl-CoA reductase-like NADH-dependent reductase (Old Yellow Enzyme family)/thioredoxin reductase n=1 Tax=Sphingobium xenophagum TaxID=121428 RepID=A0ABU1X5H7_SPHXE|nr:FAD-dependent oxidoreductase [Sphingobium xenophagum]MDR7156828.1 2,4-dienoyl-CoA reductase-like NADH-dependent reductase (Old Yellow Enzyme family)/thioredoxin reductase [Sphingobium xenophagum]